MAIIEGTKYQISEGVKCYFNSAGALTIIRQNGVTAQFILANGKGAGAMPIQHFNYLLKRDELTEITNKHLLLREEDIEEDIG